jgi:hypothetical protein
MANQNREQDRHVCEHLRRVEDHLRDKCAVTCAGQTWSKNCRFWIYFDAVLDCEALRADFGLGPGITVHVNDDPKSGREKGLFCEACKDAVVGIHPSDRKSATITIA